MERKLSKHSAIPQDCSGGTWCTKNDARTLFPVDARSDKRTVQIIRLVYLFSDTVVCAFSEAAFGEILASIRCRKTPPIRNQFSSW